MAVCDMCGKSGALFRTEVEGTTLNVCKDCTKFGKVMKRIKTVLEKKKEARQIIEKPEIEEFVVSNYSKLLRDARNKTGKTQKEFAQDLNEKESILQKIETGSFEPTLKMAKRFEKILNIKLIETIEMEEKENKKQQKEAKGLTIGDLIKVKKK